MAILVRTLLFTLCIPAWMGAMVLLWHVFVVLHEEPDLERRFGESYRRYRAEVRRWLPRPPRGP